MEYIATTTVKLFAGEVGLSDEQAALRRNKLMKIRKGFYQVLGEIHFKAGEKIKLSKLPKGLDHKLEKARKEDVAD